MSISALIPFGELSGKDLWDAMCGEELENSEIEFDPADLDKSALAMNLCCPNIWNLW
jgi:hypothetical protein